MFDHKKYVPILRWKPAEQNALQKLRNVDRSQISPLIEIIPRDFKPKQGKRRPDPKYVLRKKAEEINKCVGFQQIFIDLGLVCGITTQSSHLLEVLWKEMSFKQLSFFPETTTLVPVTSVDRNIEFQTAVAAVAKTYGSGLCLRLNRSILQRASFSNEIQNLLSFLNVNPEQVDVLVDYQTFDNSVPKFSNVCGCLPYLSRWRSFTIASGAFPKNLADLEKNAQHTLPRLDWLTWHDQALLNLPRKPNFSDYTIQYGIFEEPPQGANFSASIRYTADEYWVIMRGEGVLNKGGPGYAGYCANAQLLCERIEFCGADFSDGDEYIATMSQQTSETGNAGTWLQASINHHITFVANQIKSMQKQ